ncbi:TOBE domain-containing protein [Methanobacterium alcaliphilum]|uniref:TOBE domain-containing protein n=1 Tax=Methanobacterium alcaliphilum TaxID=392018 RepID=UPI00200A14C7|nr:TOBE domain-containing protein [Methanobacterium alcaliphilum]MCK9152378.1 TOBE domain-containing protein [Methanobacterium alcaliphilum]
MAHARNKPEYSLNINGKTLIMDSTRFELLKKIDKCGSIMGASKKTGIPYRSALKYIEVMEETVGHGVVFTTRGGRGGGGGSKLSSLGKKIIKEYTKINKVLQKVSDLNELPGRVKNIDNEKKVMHIDFSGQDIILPLSRDFNVDDDVTLLISPEDIIVMLKPQESSIRNIMPGQIIGLKLNEGMVRLEVILSNESSLDVDVTQYSKEKLGLDLGKNIFIGFKAVSISIVNN